MDYEAGFCSEECVREFESKIPGGEANAQQTKEAMCTSRLSGAGGERPEVL